MVPQKCSPPPHHTVCELLVLLALQGQRVPRVRDCLVCMANPPFFFLLNNQGKQARWKGVILNRYFNRNKMEGLFWVFCLVLGNPALFYWKSFCVLKGPHSYSLEMMRDPLVRVNGKSTFMWKFTLFILNIYRTVLNILPWENSLLFLN